MVEYNHNQNNTKEAFQFVFCFSTKLKPKIYINYEIGDVCMKRKILGVFVVASLMLTAVGCGNSNGTTTPSASNSSGTTPGSNSTVKKVGISMPTRSSERWIKDGENMQKEFKDKGYEVILQYAQNEIPTQVSNIENMITSGVNCLVIAAIDGEQLTEVLKKAADKNIKVIAYDRLIRKSANVDYYASFDNFKVGVTQASYLEKSLGLKDGKGPFNIELFAGSPDDNNATLFFKGAMSVLQPYMDSKKLVVRSGQTDFKTIAIMRWEGKTAQDRMDNILSKSYGTEKVDAVLSPYDGITIGIINALKARGYGSASKALPVTSGQDAEVMSVKSIIKGEQTSTVFKDTRILAKKAVEMATAVLKGEKPVVNDEKTYENGVKVVPSFLCEIVSVDKSNYKKELIESGYYTEAQLK
jgi:putative multiple sugar transport system substrate-binding protein